MFEIRERRLALFGPLVRGLFWLFMQDLFGHLDRDMFGSHVRAVALRNKSRPRSEQIPNKMPGQGPHTNTDFEREEFGANYGPKSFVNA